MSDLRSLANNLFPGYDKIIIVGDFNLPNISWSDSTYTSVGSLSQNFCDVLDDYFMSQLCLVPTRKSNILDVIVQIRDWGLYRDFKVGEHFGKASRRRAFLMLEDSEIPVKSEVEYLNWLLKLINYAIFTHEYVYLNYMHANTTPCDKRV